MVRPLKNNFFCGFPKIQEKTNKNIIIFLMIFVNPKKTFIIPINQPPPRNVILANLGFPKLHLFAKFWFAVFMIFHFRFSRKILISNRYEILLNSAKKSNFASRNFVWAAYRPAPGAG